MVEFGEQVKKAREAKGMTQQTLADHLYVTRQTVSRWECGNRYPDLLTAKKLATILEVSLDKLLSTEELKKLEDGTPVIEHPIIKNVLVALYAVVSFSFFITVVDIIMRFPLTSQSVGYNDIQLIVVNVLGLMVQVAIFAYGFIWALRGRLTSKKTGAVIAVYFISVCLTNSRYIANSNLGWNVTVMITDLIRILPSILGAVASYQYFCKAKCNFRWYPLLVIVSAWGAVLILLNTYSVVKYAGQFVSMNTALNLLLKICIYLLIIYQAYIVKRKNHNN